MPFDHSIKVVSKNFISHYLLLKEVVVGKILMIEVSIVLYFSLAFILLSKKRMEDLLNLCRYISCR